MIVSRRPWPGAIALLAALALSGTATAGPPIRVTVLVASEDDAVLATRIEGQTADLDAVVEQLEHAALPADLSVQLATARRVASDRDADAVVWFRHDRDGWIVHVAEPAGDRVLVRRVHEREGAMSSSAAIESVAVIVRTAIRGMAAGGEIGVSDGASVPPVVIAATPPPVAAAITPSATGASESSVRPLRPFAELGWSGVLDGAAGHHGIGARIGAAGGPFRVAAVGAHHPATTYTSSDATIEVERQAVGVALGLDVHGAAQRRRTARWRIAADLAVAMARFRRSTTSTSAGLEATAAAVSWTPVATPAVRLGRRLAPSTWITLSIGVDLVARPPEFGVAGGGMFIPVASQWPLQPHAGVGIVIDPF